VHRAAWRVNSGLRLSPLAGGQAAGCGIVNPQSGIAASVAASGAPRFPSDEALAAAGPGAKCRSVVNAARAAAVDSAASGEMSDRFAAPVAADLSALHDIDLTTGRNDGLAPAAGRAAAHHSVVVAVAQTDSYAAAAPDSSAAADPDNSSAAADNSSAAADNSSAAAIRNSVEAVIDNCVAAQSDYVPVGTGSEAGLQADWILVAGAAPDASVVTGWAPGGKNAEQNRCDDSARSTALPLKPAS
jgi:hypothetical protein